VTSPDTPVSGAATTGRSLLHHVAARAARADAGRARRETVPLDAHAEIVDPTHRPDPLETLRAQDVRRVPELVPIRYGRMLATPFTFLRGAAALMAGDLAEVPRTDLHVQLCGDAHLSNFGVFAAPDRRLVVDVNDFDETLPGPFEWDVKRLAASFVAAAQDNGFDADRTRSLTVEAVGSYRLAIHLAALADPLDLWYARVELEDLMKLERNAGRKDMEKRTRGIAEKAGRKDRLGALAKLTDIIDGQRVIVADPPLIVRPTPQQLDAELDQIAASFEEYRSGLPRDRQKIFDRYSVVDLARKVVGVGSVGTFCWVVLLESGDGEPLFLQFKEATTSVLEPHLGASEFPHSGQRVVEGQQLVQAASDVFLGWTHYPRRDGTITDFYVRQLWDGKASVDIGALGPKRLARYARFCGLVLARAHARSGDPAMISGYLGEDDAFEQAIAAFAMAYAERNHSDHARLTDAVRDGELEALSDL
jgi:uncharacterized protein (DUF2252 family)